VGNCLDQRAWGFQEVCLLAGLICLSARIFALELAIEWGFEMKVNRACNRINHSATCLLEVNGMVTQNHTKFVIVNHSLKSSSLTISSSTFVQLAYFAFVKV